MIDIESFKRNEEEELNNKKYLKELSSNKLTLRKKQNNHKLRKQRNYKLLHRNENENNYSINKQYQFEIIDFNISYNIIENYLRSNNPELISYCIKELNIYFSEVSPNIKEQNKIIETKFLNILLFFGNKSIMENNFKDLSTILNILINIQIFEEGNNEYLIDIYSYDFFNFYNKCLDYIDSVDDDKSKSTIYNDITYLLQQMVYTDQFYDEFETYNLNFLILRSSAFSKILDFFVEKNIKDIEFIKTTLGLIIYTIDFLNGEEDLITVNDMVIIDKCLNILINELFGNNTLEILVLIYQGISHITSLSGKYDRNVKVINGGVTLKILKLKFDNNINNNNDNNFIKNYLAIIIYTMRILANNLTSSEKNCKIIYDHNIIDYYNNILVKFDDYPKIVISILLGISNIAIGSKYEVVKTSIIWNAQKIQKYLNYNDEIKVIIIKIIKYLLYKNNKEIIKFIYETKILEYLMHVFESCNIGKLVCFKILDVIDYYLGTFKKETKETNEYLTIYNKFIDFFRSSEKIIQLNDDNNSNIPIIEKRIKDNYE